MKCYYTLNIIHYYAIIYYFEFINIKKKYIYLLFEYIENVFKLFRFYRIK